MRALHTGQVRALHGARSEAGGWTYTVRYEEGPDVLYPKAHPVPPSWVRSAVMSGLVRPASVDLLQTARVMEFLIPNAIPKTHRTPPMPRMEGVPREQGELL